MTEKKKVLMVCLGNICRSPIAEAVFANIIKEKGLKDKWEVDSAALIGYHTGKNPDSRATQTLKKKGIKDYVHKARPIVANDFNTFDWIFGMDKDNIRELERKKPTGSKATVELLTKYIDPSNSGKHVVIRDPYYDDDDEGFEKAYHQCVQSINNFLDQEN